MVKYTKEQICNAIKEEIKVYDETEEHNSDFNMSYKDCAYNLYKEILKYLQE